MARSIKGIKVEIGASTTGLKAALKDVDKQSRNISRELRKVNRGLKFNPDSTELLSQKQEILEEKIQTTSKRLNTLREAQEDVKKQFQRGDIDEGQYRAFRREVIQTESKLEHFNDELDDTNKRSRNLKLGFDDLKKAGNMLKTGMEAVGVAVAAAGTAAAVAVKQTADYAREIDNLSRAANVGVEEYQNLSFVLKQIGIDADEASELLVEVNRILGEAQAGEAPMVENLQALGMSVEDLQGMGTYEMFIEITEGLSEMESQADKTAVSGRLFGEDLSRKLLPAIDGTTESIEELAEEAEDMDIALSEEDIENWREFNRTSREITGELQALKREMATELLPFLQSEFLPFIQDDLIPTLKEVGDFIAKGFDLSFAYDEDGSAEQEIRDIESLGEAQETLEEKQEELAKAPDPKSIEFLKYSREERQNIIARRNTLESEIALLEYLIETRDWLNEKRETEETQTPDEPEEPEEAEEPTGRPSWLEEDVDKPEMDEEEQKRIAQEIMDSGYETAMLDMEGMQKELTQLRLDKKRELRDVEDETLRSDIEERYQARRQEIYDKYAEMEMQKEEEVMRNKFELEEISLEEYKDYLESRLDEYEKYTNEWMNIYTRLQDIRADKEKEEGYPKGPGSVDGTGPTPGVGAQAGIDINELLKAGPDAERETDKILQDFKNEMDILKDKNEAWGDSFDFAAQKSQLLYRTIEKLIESGENNTALVEAMIAQYEELNETQQKTINVMQSEAPGKGVDVSGYDVLPGGLGDEEGEGQSFRDIIDEYKSDLETLKERNKAWGDSIDFTSEKARLLKNMIDQLIKSGTASENVIAAFVEDYNELTPEEDPESLNWMTDAFVDIGYKIEEANQAFESWEDNLVNGLTEAIVQGESLSNVLTNIADRMAEMVIKEGIVEPIVTWGLDLAGLGSAHEGAYVSPAGLIQDLPSYHNGGLPGLDRDETIIKAQVGERVLSREQNAAYESGMETPIILDITAMDSQDVIRALTKDGGRAVSEALGLDYRRNGITRKLIKGGN